MKHHPDSPRPLETLDAFTALMARTVSARRQAAAAILAGRSVPPEAPALLSQALAGLEEAEDRDGLAELEAAEDQTLSLDLAEETRQLENDLIYLEDGREALFRHLAKRHHAFRDAVKRGLRAISGHGVNILLGDFDGAIRGPNQRFATAAQPAWNAVAWSRFAMARAKRPLLWTQGPMAGPGLLDLASLPPRTFAYAASLGRQYQDAEGRQGAVPLSLEKATLLESINARLAMLLADPTWRAFAFVGSGLQFRRGETVIARQDVRGSVDADDSLALLEHVHDIVDAVDPQREHFRVEDDGHDVAVAPTVAQADVWRDFSATDGLRAVDAALGLDLAQGPHLLCCGGASGLALLEALVGLGPQVHCLFVTDRDDLARRARQACAQAAVVAHPDIAAAVLSSAAP